MELQLLGEITLLMIWFLWVPPSHLRHPREHYDVCEKPLASPI